MSVVFAVDDDGEWLGYYERLLGESYDVELFQDGVAVMERTAEVVPDVMILDVLLTGPTGFSVLNEMQSHEDLASVPVIVVSGVSVKEDLTEYGVVKVFDKGEMRPEELLGAVRACDGQRKN
ncbi:response regulator [Candidatus Saccharibacteria bacterium]|nr:response regulator [Candidatus Saccharibacteria bacterium]